MSDLGNHDKIRLPLTLREHIQGFLVMLVINLFVMDLLNQSVFLLRFTPKSMFETTGLLFSFSCIIF